MKRSGRIALFALCASVCLSGCETRSVRHARQLVAAGNYQEAQNFLSGQLQAKPTDADGFVLLGQVQLLIGKATDANRSFARAVRLRPSISEELGALHFQTARKLFVEFPPSNETNDRIDTCLRGAVSRDRALAREIVDWVMKEGLSSVEKKDGRNPIPLFKMAAEISPSGEKAILETIESAARSHISAGDFPRALAMIDVLINVDENATGLASELWKDVALSMDSKGLGTGALAILRKAVKINPALEHDIDVLLLRSKLESAAPVAAPRDQETTAPSQTEGARASASAASMQVIANAIEAYRADYDRVPAASSVGGLQPLLDAYVQGGLPSSDGWGTPFVYVADEALLSYRLVCAGNDALFEPASSRIGTLNAPVSVHDPAADIILENGRFVQSHAPRS